MPTPPPPGDTTLSLIIQEFRLYKSIIEHTIADHTNTAGRKPIYSFDYNLIYPGIWPGSDTKDPQYDLIGKNIFYLLPHYASAVPFAVTLSVPSFLEFLDTIEHRYSKHLRLANSKDEAATLVDAFKKLESRTFDQDSTEGKRVKSLLLKAGLFTSHNTNAAKFIDMVKSRVVTFSNEHVDASIIEKKKELLSREYARVYEEMVKRRGPADDRSSEDKMFHYKVDSWNIAYHVVNDPHSTLEISHVCRHTIRSFYPDTMGQLYARHPIVPMYGLYALFRASSDTTVSLQAEAIAFLYDAAIEINRLIKDLVPFENRSATDLTKYLRMRIDDVYNKFIRPLFYRDYGNGGKAVNVDDLNRMRDDIIMSTYKSITTGEGFRDRFHQSAEGLKAVAKEAAEIFPQLTSDRLLEDYDLSGNPRITEIRKKLGLE